MGLQISSLIPRREISLEDLKNKKVAVDASQMLYQFLSSIRQRDGTPLMDSSGNITSHLQGIISRISNLMSKQIKLVFVFDGKPPILKVKEQEEREYRKQLAEKKLENARKEEDEELILRYSKQISRLTPSIVRESKELISALGLPIIQAPSEAEAQAAFMAERNNVDYVASSDYDALLYGAPNIIRSLTLSTRRRLPSGSYVLVKPEVIELKQTLNVLGIDRDQLIILAILIGTDYNIGGVKGIGPKNALRLVKQHKRFDDIFKEVKADFDWKSIYATIKNMPVIKDYKLKWTNFDEAKIRKILIDQHEFNQERVDKIISSLKGNKPVLKDQKGLDKWF